MEKRFFSYNGPILDVTFEKPIKWTDKEYIRAAYSRKQAGVIICKAIAADNKWLDPHDFILVPEYLKEIESPKRKTVYNDDNYNPDDDVSWEQLSMF